MISVGIFINGELIHRVEGWRVSYPEKQGIPYGKGRQFYQLNILEDKIIEHQYEDGAIKLAIKMLEELLTGERY